MLETVLVISEELAARVWGSRSGRSVDLPEGSPTRAVAPPIKAIVRWPQRRNQERTMRARRLPR